MHLDNIFMDSISSDEIRKTGFVVQYHQQHAVQAETHLEIVNYIQRCRNNNTYFRVS